MHPQGAPPGQGIGVSTTPILPAQADVPRSATRVERTLTARSGLAKSFAGSRKTEYFIFFQGLGAFLSIALVVVSILAISAIATSIEMMAGVRVGVLRRSIYWVVDKAGGGVPVALTSLAAAVVSSLLCYGVVYNLWEHHLSPGALPAVHLGPPDVTAIKLRPRGDTVTVDLRLDEPARVTIDLHHNTRGHLGATLGREVAQLGSGQAHLALVRTSPAPLKPGIYTIVLVAVGSNHQTTGGIRRSFRIKPRRSR